MQSNEEILLRKAFKSSINITEIGFVHIVVSIGM